MPFSPSSTGRRPLGFAATLHRQDRLLRGGQVLAGLLWAALSLPFWSSYLPLGPSLLIALLPAPLVLAAQPVPARGWRYLPWALLLLAAYPWLHSRVLLFMGSGLALLVLIEARGYRLSRLAPVWLLLLSPVPDLVVDVFSFSLRLQLSAWTAATLGSLGFPVEVYGNAFVVDGQRYLIEAACLGLNMVVTGLVATTFLLAQAEQGQPWPVWRQAVVYLAALLLLGIANFARTLLLVLLRSAPETLSHELTGLVALLLYVLLPVAGLVRWLRPPAAPAAVPAGARGHWLPVGLVLAALTLAMAFHYAGRPAETPIAWETPAGWERLPHGVLRQETEGVLCYRKPPVAAWQAGHSPLVCWQGSGYTFGTIAIETVEGLPVYVAELTQPGWPLLHTAWWYSNGAEQTLSPWTCRWRQLQGEAPFALVNLTTGSRDSLLAAVAARRHW